MKPSNEDVAAFLARHPGIETMSWGEIAAQTPGLREHAAALDALVKPPQPMLDAVEHARRHLRVSPYTEIADTDDDGPVVSTEEVTAVLVRALNAGVVMPSCPASDLIMAEMVTEDGTEEFLPDELTDAQIVTDGQLAAGIAHAVVCAALWQKAADAARARAAALVALLNGAPVR